jgi:PKD repeat protein
VKIKLPKIYSIFLLVLLIGILSLNPFHQFIARATDIAITVTTDKTLYFERERVRVNCTLTGNYSSESDFLGIEVRSSAGVLLFRTLKIGEAKTIWAEILGGYLSDSNGFPVSKVRVGSTAYFNFSFKVNFPSPPVDTCATITICDAKNVALGATFVKFPSFTEGIYPFVVGVPVPVWATLGSATVYVSLFTDVPELNGVPYCSEFVKTFPIASKSGFIPSDLDTFASSVNLKSTNTGTFKTEFRLSCEPQTGEYSVYAASKVEGVVIKNAAVFSVESASYPPIAYFIYSPPKPYPGCIVYFDASGSTADGGTITNYTWNFGDGSGPVTKIDPEISHTYTNAGVYNVTLKVTDSEGLWSILQMPLKVWAPYGPTADFTYTPKEPFKGAFITFNASTSKLGWNGTYYPPITNYIWNFGDGSPLVNENDPITTHVYSAEGNYSVTLKVIDQMGQWDTETKQLNVTLVPIIHDIAVTQLDFIPETHHGWQVEISVTVNNSGSVAETFNLEIYLNTSLLYNQTIVQLNPLETQTKIYTLNTALFSTGFYVIKAAASVVIDETNIENNVLEGPFRIKIMADIDGDGSVGPIDLGLLGAAWGSFEGDLNFNVQCDLDQDGSIGPLDLGTMGAYWGSFE